MSASHLQRAKGVYNRHVECCDTHVATVVAKQLPLEVWARIFDHLRPDTEGAAAPSMYEVAMVMADQAHFHTLKLVCSQFRDVFAVHPDLSNEVSIGSAAYTQLPGLLL